MTNEEAIKMLKSKMNGTVDTSYEWCEALRMAIEALKERGELYKIIKELADEDYYNELDREYRMTR